MQKAATSPIQHGTKILVVGGDSKLRRQLEGLLEDNGYDCTVATSAEKGRRHLKIQAFELILCDMDLPNKSGLNFTRHIIAEHPDSAAIIMTGENRTRRTSLLEDRGLYGWISKPLMPGQVLLCLDNALRRRELEIAHRVVVADSPPSDPGALLRSERHDEWYRRLIEGADDLMLGTDTEGHLIWVNPMVQKVTGYAEEELIGKHFLHFIRKDYRNKAKRFYGRQLARKIPNTHFRLPAVTKGGKELWLGQNVQLLTDEGRVFGFQVVARDITEHQRGEKELSRALKESRQRQAQISALFEGARAVLEYREFKDAVKSILCCCKRLLGATGGYIILLPENESIDDVLFLDTTGCPAGGKGASPSLIRKVCKDAQRDGKTTYQNEPVRGKWAQMIPGQRGPLKNILVSPLVINRQAAGLLALANKPGGFYANDAHMASAFGELAAVALHNSRTLESLEISEQFFRSVVQTASDAIVSADSEGNIIFWNQGAEKTFGYTASEALGKSLSFIMPSRFQDAHSKSMDLVVSTGKRKTPGQTIEVVGVNKERHEVPIELSIATWKTRDGIFFTGISRDISERKLAEDALRQAKRDAEIANRAKSEFLANMSHEIRTPMNAIIGMADLLRETPLTSEQQQYVRVFHTAGDTLLSLIDDILDLSKLDDGHQLKLERIEFDPFDLVEKTCEIMALRAHQKGIELAFQVMPNVPTPLVGDPLRLRQILINLIGNAVKFTEQGEVVVRVATKGAINAKQSGRRRETKGPINLLFSVTDTGIGIPEKKIDAIFETFAQADSSTTRQYGGTGLGLTISKRLVELMEGTIWVESELERGSTFLFTVKLESKTKRTGRKAFGKGERLEDIKTLVVDDNATYRGILKEMITSWGAKVKEAESGDQALAELNRAKRSGRSYDLLMLDSRMPGTGGFQVAEAIHNDPALARITIMMLTSDHRRNDVNKALELGISACLVKPIRPTSLRDTITEASQRKGQRDRRAQPPSQTGKIAEEKFPALSILLVEDSHENCLLIRAFLAKTPCEIDTAENGQIAVEKFKSRAYDLVLMDMQMPLMDGYTATGLIRAWEAKNRNKAVPIIALTAYALDEDARKSLEAGCTFHLSKPIRKAVLLETIREYAHRKGSSKRR